MDSLQVSEKVVSLLENKKAKDIVAINIENVTILADYFVICNGSSTTHIKSLADEIEKCLGAEGGPQLLHREGYNSARWILLDYGDVVIHVFHENDRKFYDIERLWSDGVITYRG